MRKLALALSLVVVCPLFAQEDAENCSDSTVLTRMPKCYIHSCEKKDFDEAEIRLTADGDNFKTQHVEGAKDYIVYVCDESVSFLNIARNAEAALKKAGFTIVFFGKGQNEHPALSARKGGVWVDIQTEWSGPPAYYQTIVQTKQMEETMTATAAAFEEEIAKTGSCSIYGILFDTAKASIKPESAECLGEVVKLLKKNADWKMQIEGHTDNVGAAKANMTLSQQRAESVKTWLAGKGIAGARLSAKGFGDSMPIAENNTDDGRAKNRRVALRKL